MAEQKTRESILKIVVDNNSAVKSIAEYQKEIDECRSSIKEWEKTIKDADKAVKENAMTEEEANRVKAGARKEIIAEQTAMNALRKEMNAVNYQLQKNIQENAENEGSLKSLRGQLSQLTAQYDALGREARNGEAGERLKGQIADVYNELKKAEEETGRFQRNVGNYSMKMVEGFDQVAESITGTKTPLSNAATGFKALRTASGWIGLLIQLLVKMVQSVKGNEEAMNGLRVAFAPLAGMGTAFNKVLEKMGNWLGSVATKVATLAKRLGLFSKEMEVEQELTQAEINLNQKRRDVLVANAEAEREIADLKAKTAEKDKYNAKQRLAFWEEIGKKEEDVALREKQIADEEYRIAVERGKQGANTKEDNDRIAELHAKSIEADTKYLNKVREVNAQLAAVRAEMKKGKEEELEEETQSTEDITKSVNERLKLYAKEAQMRLSLAEEGSALEHLRKQEKLQADFDLQMAELEQQEGTEELQKLARMKFNEDMQALEDEYFNAQQEALAQETDAILEELEREAEGERAIAEYRKQTQIATASAIAGAIGSLGDVMSAFGDEDKKMAKMSKVLALAKIAVETGIATASGIAQAQSVPFPANIAAIASTIATIAGGMASAVSSVKSAKFAKGGLVTGAGTGTSDSIPARLSNGESVMTANATSMFGPLLSSLNQMAGGNAIGTPSGASTAILEQAIARGMQSARLSVSVSEIDSVRDRMNAIEQVAYV